MRTKIVSKILSETPEEIKEKVRNNANNLINKKMNIQDEVQKIHNQYGTSEMANYQIEKLFDKEKKKFKRFYDLAVAEDEQQDFIYLNEKIKRTDLDFLKDSNEADA